jgi:hypothetical protein
VAKRVRGSHSTHRPGGHVPVRAQKPPATPTAASSTSPNPAWDADIDQAIDSVILETTEVTIEDPVVPVPAAGRTRKRVTVKSDSLQARVSAENVYVREDLRRIAVVSAILVAGLAVAWVLIVLLDVLGLY